MLGSPWARRDFDSHGGCSQTQCLIPPDNSAGKWPSCFHPSSPDTDYCLCIIFANQGRILVSCLFMSSDLHFILSPAAIVEPSMLPGHHFTHLWLAALPVPTMDIWNLHQSSQYPSHPWSLRENEFLPHWKCRGCWACTPATYLLSIPKSYWSAPILPS